jgi:nicotinamide mononucleotide adenylyltransferase
MTTKKEQEKHYPIALIIGRFQPFCNNHFELLETVVKKYIPQKLILGIGVCGMIDEKNFLNYDEIKTMIEPILEDLNVNYEIKPIPDIHNPPKYAEHVKSIFTEISEKNTRIFTDNTYLSDCFVNYGHNFKIITPEISSDVRATTVRLLMKNGGEWGKMVPKCVEENIKANNYFKRLI